MRRNSWPRSRPHWCVRDCDAVSQQDLEEETGCGQADCSIMPGTCKLHDQHVTVHWHSCWALLFHLQEATYKNAQRNARCPDHALYRTRSAHAGAEMLFNVQRSQEFIFCLAENHFHDESSLGLSMDLACHLELSELRTSNHATNVGGCVASFAKHATAAPTARAQKTESLASGPWQTRV